MAAEQKAKLGLDNHGLSSKVSLYSLSKIIEMIL